MRDAILRIFGVMTQYGNPLSHHVATDCDLRRRRRIINKTYVIIFTNAYLEIDFCRREVGEGEPDGLAHPVAAVAENFKGERTAPLQFKEGAYDEILLPMPGRASLDASRPHHTRRMA